MRKYQTEFGINAYPNYKKIVSPTYLEYLESHDSHKYHIYGILLAPKFFIKPGSIVLYEDHFSITLFTNINKEYKEYPIDIRIDPSINHNDVEITSTYPHSILCLRFKNRDWGISHFGSNYIDLNATELFNLYGTRHVERMRYKVLYIGQAYGQRGERSAIERLSSHSTFQKILIDCQSHFPEYEIQILLLEMNYKLDIGIEKPSLQTTESDTEDREHIKKVLSDLPREQQLVNITEAALINYFKPVYNKNFVENFPCPNHKSYRQYYDLDYNEITIELDMEFDNFPYVELYTDDANIPSVWRFIHYQLENSDRESMYAMFKK